MRRHNPLLALVALAASLACTSNKPRADEAPPAPPEIPVGAMVAVAAGESVYQQPDREAETFLLYGEGAFTFRAGETHGEFVALYTVGYADAARTCNEQYRPLAAYDLRFFVPRDRLARLVGKTVTEQYAEGFGFTLHPGAPLGPRKPQEGGPSLYAPLGSGLEFSVPVPDEAIVDFIETDARAAPEPWPSPLFGRTLDFLDGKIVPGEALEVAGSMVTAVSNEGGKSIATVSTRCADFTVVVPPEVPAVAAKAGGSRGTSVLGERGQDVWADLKPGTQPAEPFGFEQTVVTFPLGTQLYWSDKTPAGATIVELRKYPDERDLGEWYCLGDEEVLGYQDPPVLCARMADLKVEQEKVLDHKLTDEQLKAIFEAKPSHPPAEPWPDEVFDGL